MNSVARSFGARALSFIPTALATLLTSRLILENYGVGAFGAFALILSLINIVPLNNLGVGAAITSALATDGPGSQRAERTVLTAARVLAVSSLGTAVVALAFAALGLWQPLLGQSSGPDLWIGIAMVVYAISFLPGLGQSMLLGVHRNHTTILIQAFFNPGVALLAGLAVLTKATPGALIALPCVSLVAINLVTAYFAGRATGISWRTTLRRLPYPKRFPGATIRAMSGPVLLITLSTPIALQSDRIVLSHVGTAEDVAQYSIALQIFAPALVLIAATAQPLWPIWAQARARGERGPGVVKVVGLFCLGGLVVGAALALLAGPVALLVAGSAVRIDPLLALAGALAVLTAAASHPVAMSLMDESGVKVVVRFTVIALPLNVGLSIVLGQHLGAPGPLFASCIVGLLVQALPGLVVSRNRQRAAAAATAPAHRVRGGHVVPAPYRPFDRPEDALAPARPRPGPGPRRAAEPATVPATDPAAASAADSAAAAAAAYTAAATGAADLGGGAGAYPEGRASHRRAEPAGPVLLQPVAPFRRPSDPHRRPDHGR